MNLWNSSLPTPCPNPGDLIRFWRPGQDVVPAHVLEVDEGDPLIIDVVPIGTIWPAQRVRCAHALGGPSVDEPTWSWPVTKFDVMVAERTARDEQQPTRIEQVAEYIRHDYRPRCEDCKQPFMHDEPMVQCHGLHGIEVLHARCAARRPVVAQEISMGLGEVRVGTFEWAMLAMRAGYRVRRSVWSSGAHFVIVSGGIIATGIAPALSTILSTDWEIAQ